MLLKAGEDQLDRSCGKWRNMAKSEGEESVLHTITRRKGNWIGHILHGNCLLKHVIGGKIEGRMEVTGKRGRRRKQLLDDLKENRRYGKLKEETRDRTLWSTGFGRGCGPVERRTVCVIES
jgi:hypothetical protein